jgi:hypothetical protein
MISVCSKALAEESRSDLCGICGIYSQVRLAPSTEELFPRTGAIIEHRGSGDASQ